MASRSKKSRAPKKRVARRTSNVFAMFEQAQIQEFKEAFNVIDQNRDGFIDKDDLREVYGNFGKEVEDSVLNEMLDEAPGPINFTMFLMLFGDKMNGSDPEDVIINALSCFDDRNCGRFHKDQFIEALRQQGERFTDEEIDLTLKLLPMDSNGWVDYHKLAYILKRGAPEF